MSTRLVLSALLGNMSHVLLDLTTHANTPVLWPFLPSDALSPVPLVFGGLGNAILVIHALMIILFLPSLLEKRGNLVERLLVQ